MALMFVLLPFPLLRYLHYRRPHDGLAKIGLLEFELGSYTGRGSFWLALHAEMIIHPFSCNIEQCSFLIYMLCTFNTSDI
jgi:hypothetical protein